MTPPKNVKEVQSLNGKVAALNRFVLRATNKCLPFFCMLKKSFEWTANYQKAFEDLKAYLSSSSLLSPSKPGENFFLYLAVSLAIVSAALIREEDQVKKTRVLHQPSTSWGRGKVPPDGEACLRFSYCSL